MIYGYARCSTNEGKQDIQRQTRELKSAGAEKIFLEYEHVDSAVKEQLSTLLEIAKAGDRKQPQTTFPRAFSVIIPHIRAEK